MSALLTDPRYWDSKDEHQIAYWQHMDRVSYGGRPRHLNIEGSDDRDRPFWVGTLVMLVFGGLTLMTSALTVAYTSGSGMALLGVALSMVVLYFGAQVWERMIRVEAVDADDLPYAQAA